MDLVGILVYLLIMVIFLGVCWFLITKLPGEIQGWARMIFIVICAIVAIVFLVQFVGGTGIHFGTVHRR